jgi:regulator of replication initiation timing
MTQTQSSNNLEALYSQLGQLKELHDRLTEERNRLQAENRRLQAEVEAVRRLRGVEPSLRVRSPSPEADDA